MDIVFSIGLLEHFEDIEPPLREQVRVLDKGGLFLGYVVPKYKDNVQRDYTWLVEILKGYSRAGKATAKLDLFRSDAGSEQYLPVLKRLGLSRLQASGVYPLPMISHSIEFPFTLMPPLSELALVYHLEEILADVGHRSDRHHWLCKEGFGQAFLIWGVKL
jgi:SAM-dependent methyltransferase